MAINLEAGEFTSPAFTGNQDITSVGFQPQVVLFLMNARTTSGSESNGSLTVGGAVSSSSRFHTTAIVQNTGSTYNHSRHTNAKCISYYWLGPTLYEEADFVSFLSNGFRINWTTADIFARVVDYFCIGNADNIAIKQFTSSTSTGDQAITGVGFQPDSIMIFSCDMSSSPPANETDARLMFGLSDGTNDRCVSIFADYGSSRVSRSKKNDAIINTANDYGTLIHRATLDSFDSDGFTLNWSTASGTARYFWAVCIKGVDAKVGTITQTSTGSQSYTIGHASKAAIMSMDGNTTDNTTDTNYASFMLGFGDSDSDYGRIIGRQGSTGYAGQALDQNDLMDDMEYTFFNNIFAGDVSSWDSNGFTMNWTPVDVSGREVYYMSFSTDGTIEASAACAISMSCTANAEVTKEASSQSDLQFSCDASAEVSMEAASECDIQFTCDSDTVVLRGVAAQCDISFTCDSTAEVDIDANSQCDILFTCDSNAEVAKEVSSQCDIQFSCDSVAKVAIDASSQCDIQFTFTAEPNLYIEGSSICPITFGCSSSAVRDRSCASQCDISFACDSLASREREGSSLSVLQFTCLSSCDVLREAHSECPLLFELTANGLILVKSEVCTGRLLLPVGEGASGKLILPIGEGSLGKIIESR